jgi:hypothetical protein
MERSVSQATFAWQRVGARDKIRVPAPPRDFDELMRAIFGFTCVALLLSAFGIVSCAPTDSSSRQSRATQVAQNLPPHHERNQNRQKLTASPFSLTAVDLGDAVRPVETSGAIELTAAKNEWTSFVLRVGPRAATPVGGQFALRLSPLKHFAGASTVPASNVEAFQVLSMPIDTNRAGYVRHTGQNATRGELPRALIPMSKSDGGVIDLATLRDASRPTDKNAAAPAAEPELIWVDARVPTDAPPGDYSATCDAISNGQVVASVPLRLHVHDFGLPDERHLQVIGQLTWEDLARLYADRFEAIRPQLVSRNDKNHAGAVRVIESLLTLAHRHRTSIIVPGLQPIVKWPPAAPPEVTWDLFDSVVSPWFKGETFDDKIPLAFWSLPPANNLANYKPDSQRQYWSAASTHFDQMDWLDRCPVWLPTPTQGRVADGEAAEISSIAAQTLALHQRLRVAVPLEADQLRVSEGSPAKPGEIDPSTTGRLVVAAPALVTAPPVKFLPDGAEKPVYYLRADTPALVPYVGVGGDERDVRLWAWLAFLRQASLIHFPGALPTLNNPTEWADPNELIWFYPGEWFGVTEPVATLQLKWLRRAQQDFEYLWLAREHGDLDTRVNALLMSQLIAKPVEIQPGQSPDPAYALMSGTTDPQVWTDARRLLAEMILLCRDGPDKVEKSRANAIGLEVVRWATPQERPILMGRTVQWLMDPASPPNEPALLMRFGVDIYNAAGLKATGENLLSWSAIPTPAWQVNAQPSTAPALTTYNVRRGTLDGSFALNKLSLAAQMPMELTFTDGFKKRPSSLKVRVPVAASDRREGQLKLDGQLAEDWFEADVVHDGPLVKMLSRPALQQQHLEPASTPSKVFTSWAEGNFYVAFDVAGVSPGAASRATNFVDYQFRRAWGEDLCEILLQPVDAGGLPGPVLHVVCKPNGVVWVERKGERSWAEVGGEGVKQASSTAGDRWRGEVKIPWQAVLNSAAAGNAKGNVPAQIPELLRFNFTQHRAATGESASWAGPVDFGRDETFMGVLYLRDPDANKGPNNVARDNNTLRRTPSPPTQER